MHFHPKDMGCRAHRSYRHKPHIHLHMFIPIQQIPMFISHRLSTHVYPQCHINWKSSLQQRTLIFQPMIKRTGGARRRLLGWPGSPAHSEMVTSLPVMDGNNSMSWRNANSHPVAPASLCLVWGARRRGRLQPRPISRERGVREERLRDGTPGRSLEGRQAAMVLQGCQPSLST